MRGKFEIKPSHIIAHWTVLPNYTKIVDDHQLYIQISKAFFSTGHIITITTLIRSDETSASDSGLSSPVQQITPNNSPMLTRWIMLMIIMVMVVVMVKPSPCLQGDDIFTGGSAVSTYSLSKKEDQFKRKVKFRNVETPYEKGKETNSSWYKIPTVFNKLYLYLAWAEMANAVLFSAVFVSQLPFEYKYKCCCLICFLQPFWLLLIFKWESCLQHFIRLW